MDSSVLYRLTNSFLGHSQSLEVNPDGSGRLMMAPTGDSTGQLWRLVDRGDGKYALQTSYLGECFSLDVINDGVNTTPCLAATGDVTGQMWTLTPWPDGTYRLTSDFTGPDTSLDTSTDTHDPWLNTGDHTGQHWTLTSTGPVPGTAPIPALDPKTAGQQNEGPTDFTRFARPQGLVKAVMLFVDFPDAPAGSASATATADHLRRRRPRGGPGRRTPGHMRRQADQGLTRQAGRMPARAVILGFGCPAHGHRVKVASGVAARSASLNPDPAPARTTHQTSKAQMAVSARWLRMIGKAGRRSLAQKSLCC